MGGLDLLRGRDGAGRRARRRRDRASGRGGGRRSSVVGRAGLHGGDAEGLGRRTGRRSRRCCGGATEPAASPPAPPSSARPGSARSAQGRLVQGHRVSPSTRSPSRTRRRCTTARTSPASKVWSNVTTLATSGFWIGPSPNPFSRELLGGYSRSLTRWPLNVRDRHGAGHDQGPELHHPRGLGPSRLCAVPGGLAPATESGESLDA
jgi:hypothetical protein